MSEGVVARRYARALFELAEERQALEQVGGDLAGVCQIIAESPSFEAFLLHPQIGIAEKKSKIRHIFAGKISDYVLNAICLLIDRRREDIFTEVAREFVKLSNDAQGIVDARVYSAIPLQEGQLNEISRQFGQKVNKTLRVQNEVDPAVIGGLVIRIGDRIYDGSIQGKLSRFKQSLA